MIRIVNTNNKKLSSNYDGKWRGSKDAQRLMGSEIDGNTSCSTPQSDVDAIAVAMDNPEILTPKSSAPEYDTNQPQSEVLGNAKEQDIANMMQNYIKQNGGVVQDEQNPKVKKNQTLFR